MKQLFTSIILIILLTSCAKFVPTEIENGKLLGVLPMQYGRASYQVSKSIENADQDEVFRQVRKWAAFHMRDPNQSLSVSDNRLGDVIVGGRIASRQAKVGKNLVNLYAVNYAISIEAFDKGYRITMTNFKIEQTLQSIYPVEVRPTGIQKKTVRVQFQAIDEYIQALLKDLSEFVPAEVVREDRK